MGYTFTKAPKQAGAACVSVVGHIGRADCCSEVA